MICLLFQNMQLTTWTNQWTTELMLVIDDRLYNQPLLDNHERIIIMYFMSERAIKFSYALIHFSVSVNIIIGIAWHNDRNIKHIYSCAMSKYYNLTHHITISSFIFNFPYSKTLLIA